MTDVLVVPGTPYAQCGRCYAVLPKSIDDIIMHSLWPFYCYECGSRLTEVTQNMHRDSGPMLPCERIGCGVLFVPRSDGQRFCSMHCWYKRSKDG